ncbi:MAG: hypothetical protein M1812_006816 [Candelaria pacifica]|nr:MAG: hypothetical protein M1812_006816 [Candelaria pacifica]
MQTPSQTVPLDLTPPKNATDKERDSNPSSPLAPGISLQRIVRFDLKEEGRHILAVRVNFSETLLLSMDDESGLAKGEKGRQAAGGGRTRTFRKLYQFEAQPCLNVRTKITPINSRTKGGGQGGQESVKVALEAQLEHVGENAIVLESVTMTPTPFYTSTSLSHLPPTITTTSSPSPPQPSNTLTNTLTNTSTRLQTLNPRDIIQVAFLLTPQNQKPQLPLPKNKNNNNNNSETQTTHNKDNIIATTKDKSINLGHINIAWRSAMGDYGFLSTGLLGLRRG